MPKQGKSPKKKTKEKSPQRTEESEYPAMDEETYNRLLRNAIEHSKAELQQQLQQQHEEQLKAVEERLTSESRCPGNYNVADFFSKLLEKGLFTMHAHRFGMNFEETIVGKLTELYQTVHLKEFTDFPKKDEKDPTTVFTDIHFEKKSIAHEAYHLSHGYCQ